MIETNASDVADELMEEFSDFEQMFEEEKERALREAQRLAKERAPVDSGRLRDSISIDLEEDLLFTNVEYAVYQEFGTVHIEPVFFMRDSMLDAFNASVERLRRS